MKHKSLLKAIRKLKKRDRVRLHMPGVRGNGFGFFGTIFKHEFTEIGGLDNLYCPDGLIKELQINYARKISAKSVLFMVNGSTGGVLSMLSAFKGKKLIIVRDFHVSCGNAITLFDIDPVYVYPKLNREIGMYDAVEFNAIKAAYDLNPDASGIYLTYPNYYGFCANIELIVAFAHLNNIPVILDSAHSACFSYNDKLPMSPQQAGADIWTTSLHKTMPALNQTAYIGLSKSSYYTDHDVKERINIFQTTSPSYILLSSIEFACNYFNKSRLRNLDRLIDKALKIEKKINRLNTFSAISSEENVKDPLKLIVDHKKSKYTMKELTVYFNKKGIYFELINTRFILFMISPVTEKYALLDVYHVLRRLDSRKQYVKEDHYPISMPITCNIKCDGETKLVEVYQSVHRISANPVGIYPPGIPILLKGDVITEEIAKEIHNCVYAKLGTFGIIDRKILVYKNKQK